MILLLIYYLILFFFLISFVLLWIRDKRDLTIEKKDTPFVSILLAVRNEENTIVRCLNALSNLNYPQFEVLIGNDRSEDQTKKIVENFIQGKNNFKVFDIHAELGMAKGKANVLAHLAKQAKGEYFFITDADIKVPSYWIPGMLKHSEEKTGIVSGVTVIEGQNLFGKLQSLEWIFAFGMIKTVSDLRIPVTAVGNNMMIARKAYESVGGYENIPFSITEDFQLFRETLKKGWAYKNIVNAEVLAYSKPAENISHLLKQRKRWMTGAFRLPWLLVVCLLIQSLFFPVMVITLVLFPVWGVLLWMSKILLQQVYIALVMRRMNAWSGLLKYFVLFEIYSGLLSFFLLIYYILPVRVEWKGRKY